MKDNLIRRLNMGRAAAGNLAGRKMRTAAVMVPLFIAMAVCSALFFTADGLLHQASSAALRAEYGIRAGIAQLLWLILLAAVLITAWTQGATTALESGKEIGVLKAHGWGIGDILELKMYEGLLTAVVGTSAGLAAGLVYVLFGSPALTVYFLGCTCPEAGFPVSLHVRVSTLTALAAVGILPLLTATLIPAWLMSIIEPDEAIRG